MPNTPRLDLPSFLDPGSVAIIGASPNPAGHAGRCLSNLVNAGFRGKLYPVNPKYDEVLGREAYPDIGSVPGTVDTAYVLLPARLVEETVEACARNGVRNVVICSSGFAELGDEGRAAQERLRDIAHEYGTRLLGPNCIGVLNVHANYLGTPTFNITTDHTPGGISILSHSGGMAAVTFNRAQGRGVGIRSVVSLGNEADLGMAELVDALVDDPLTEVIALFVEELRDGARFAAAAQRARAAGKPVVALKTGRSAAGRRAAFGHTGALAGEHRVFSGVMRQLGVVEVETIDDLLTTADLLQRLPKLSGRRLGVLSPSGGETSYVADRASAAGLELPELEPDTVRRLEELLPLGSPGNPLDATGQVIGDRELLDEVLRTFSDDPNLDVVLFSIPTWGDYDNEALLPAFIERARTAAKPVVISAWQARNLTESGDGILRHADVPTTGSPDEAVRAIGRVADVRADLTAGASTGTGTPQQLRRPSSGPLTPNEHDGKRLLSGAGLPVAPEALVQDATAAAEAAEQLGLPVVVKLLAVGVTHKSDLGLVRVDLRTTVDVRSAVEELRATAKDHDLPSDGILVSRFVRGTEIIVGTIQDATFGPVIMVGAGGILAEHQQDVAFRRTPLEASQAGAMLAELSVDGVLHGLRGHRPDRDALVQFLQDLGSVVAASPDLAELDLNPVIVRDESEGGGVWIVDAALRWRPGN